MVMCRPPTQPLINGGAKVKNVSTNLPRLNKEKVVVVVGATGTGKSRLSIDLAGHFPAEIINSDKMQAYEGLDIVTNKITEEEQSAVPHHLLGTQNPNSEFTAANFCDMASLAIETITGRGKLPIIVGGSNSYVEALIDDDDYKFRSRYDFCCVWIDVSMPVLHWYVGERVDEMLGKGMVSELREYFNPKGDYSLGIRKAIGVPEFDKYFRSEASVDEETREKLMEEAVREMKENTRKLAGKQLGKIERLRNVKRWKMQRVDATPVFRARGGMMEDDEVWKKVVTEPSVMMVDRFLHKMTAANLRLSTSSFQTAIASSSSSSPQSHHLHYSCPV